MRAMRLSRTMALVVCGFIWLASLGAQAPQNQSRWAKPAAELAAQIADIVGPGQAQLTIRNLSNIPAGELPEIRKLLEQDLKVRGVLISGNESANVIRITLSEDARERLWVAEVIEGNATRVAIVRVDGSSTIPTNAAERVVLRKERIPGLQSYAGGVMQRDPVLAAAEINGHFLVMYPDRISVFSSNAGTWIQSDSFAIERRVTRDPRGVLIGSADGGTFTAYAPGAECNGSYSLPLSSPNAGSGWTVRCRASDDPWPVYQTADASSAPALKAFYNTSRDYFTGVVTPSIGVDLPPFYAAGMIPRAAGGAALLIAGIDSKVQLVENGTMRVVAGTRDWGSDFAVVRSGCGAGTQVIVSGSGEARNDSLRAFEIPAVDAVPITGPLAMDGTVMALWTAQDGKSAMAVVRNAANEYEVDRVTALCN
jgi:hypothetical protein